jgi:hypothetical protein
MGDMGKDNKISKEKSKQFLWGVVTGMLIAIVPSLLYLIGRQKESDNDTNWSQSEPPEK